MLVDVHTHFYPAEYLRLLEEAAPQVKICTDRQGRRYLEWDGTRLATLTWPMVDLQERARLVGQHPATVQVLSLTSPNVYVFPPAEAVRAARLANRAYAQIKDRYPDRFRALASVPLGTGAELEELDYAVSGLGLDGVVVGTTVGSRPLDDPLFQPFWERANQLGLVVLLHPMGGLASPLLRDFSLVPLVGFPAETTVTLARLAYSGFFQRYPRVKVVAPHAGGALPYLLGRLDMGYAAYAECAACGQPPSQVLQAVYFDTVNTYPPALRCLLEAVGPQRVVFGSDYPHVIGAVDRSLEALQKAGLEPEAMEAVLWRNARDQLGLL